MTREQWIKELSMRRLEQPQQIHMHSHIRLTLDEAVEIENLLRSVSLSVVKSPVCEQHVPGLITAIFRKISKHIWHRVES